MTDTLTLQPEVFSPDRNLMITARPVAPGLVALEAWEPADVTALRRHAVTWRHGVQGTTWGLISSRPLPGWLVDRAGQLTPEEASAGQQRFARINQGEALAAIIRLVPEALGRPAMDCWHTDGCRLILAAEVAEPGDRVRAAGLTPEAILAELLADADSEVN